MTCSKAFSLTIDPDVVCPDWGTLLWAAPIFFGDVPPDGVLAFTPNTAPGASYHASGSAVDFISGGFILMQAAVDAQLTYNGTGCNCKVTVVFAGTGDDSESLGSINVKQDGVSIIGGPQQFHPSTAGSYELTFSLTNTGGLGVPIDVRIEWLCNNFAGGPASVDMAGTFSNVP